MKPPDAAETLDEASGASAVQGKTFGSASMTAPLRRVLVRPLLPGESARWREHGWRAEPDYKAAAAEHEAFCLLLEEAGVELIVSQHDRGNPNAIYTHDPALVGREGAVLLRPANRCRRSEPQALAPVFLAAGVPIAAELTAPALAEGGDMLWLDEQTLLVGLGYRTNEEAIALLEAAFPGVEIITFDLPNWNGKSECMHLLSFISPLDSDLALVYARLAPVRLLRRLAERGIRVVEVPDEEFDSLGPNVLALAPRRALALEGNPETQKRMERAGVDVTVYRGEEMSRKGDGGPTCLTRPLLRA